MANSTSPRPVPKAARLVIALLLVLVSAGWLMAHEAAPPRPDFGYGSVTITGPAGRPHVFAVEVARSDAEQAYGLMYRTRLNADQGMIFPYDPPRAVAFWMKNTLVPLDLLFVTADGHIGKITANAVPNDVTPLPSDMPVSSVVEIAGGQAAKDGLAEGDRVDFAAR